MIADHYINEGIRIRKNYLHNMREIIKEEPKILQRKNLFEKLKNEMEVIVKSDTNEMRKTLELTTKLLTLEKEIKSIQDIIRPYHENIEKLKDDTDKLYLAIKEKYPNITTDQIQQEISSKLME